MSVSIYCEAKRLEPLSADDNLDVISQYKNSRLPNSPEITRNYRPRPQLSAP